MSGWVAFDAKELEKFLRDLLALAGADDGSAAAVSKSVVEASLRGVDTHGVILFPHYVRAMMGGRINGRPNMKFRQITPGTGLLDADNGFGHHAGYEAISHAIELARISGIAAVSVANSSHFGAAAGYTLEAARHGYVSFAFSHSDAVVVPFEGTKPFNGTNPIAFAAPVRGQHPLSVDIATSSIAWNRMVLLREAGFPLPNGVVVDNAGSDTTDYDQASALLPLGGRMYGHKGAALASIVEVMSSALSGMHHGNKLIRMDSTDLATPRHLGHFLIVLSPEAFVPRTVYDRVVCGYLSDLRAQPSEDGRVLAPGDKEEETTRQRLRDGVPILKSTLDDLGALAECYSLSVPTPVS